MAASKRCATNASSGHYKTRREIQRAEETRNGHVSCAVVPPKERSWVVYETAETANKF